MLIYHGPLCLCGSKQIVKVLGPIFEIAYLLTRDVKLIIISFLFVDGITQRNCREAMKAPKLERLMLLVCLIYLVFAALHFSASFPVLFLIMCHLFLSLSLSLSLFLSSHTHTHTFVLIIIIALLMYLRVTSDNFYN